MEFLETLKTAIMPIYETLLQPIVDSFGYWTIALFIAILGLTALLNKVFVKFIKVERVRKNALVVTRYLLSALLIWLTSWLIFGNQIAFSTVTTSAVIAGFSAGAIYTAFKFFGLKELLAITLKFVLKIIKSTNLTKELAKKIGVNKFIIDKIFETIETEVDKIKVSNKAISNYDAYLKAEANIIGQMKVVLDGVIDTKNIKLNKAVEEINIAIKTKLTPQ